MRMFSRPSGIERLSLEARIVYTAFCLFLLIGYGSSVWFYLDDDLGVTSARAATYYLGSNAPAAQYPKAEVEAAVGAEAGQGPDLALPDSQGDGGGAPVPMHLTKPVRQVMETFHFHLFSVSVCLLIVAHLFMMCGLGQATKAWVIGLSSAATLLHLLTPPLIRLVSPGYGVLMFPSAAVMGLGWLIMTLWPVVEMWGRSYSR